MSEKARIRILSGNSYYCLNYLFGGIFFWRQTYRQTVFDIQKTFSRRLTLTLPLFSLQEGVLDPQGSNIRGSTEETRQSPQMTYKFLLAKRTIAQANRRVKRQGTVIAALRANVKNKDKRWNDIDCGVDLLQTCESMWNLFRAGLAPFTRGIITCANTIRVYAIGQWPTKRKQCLLCLFCIHSHKVRQRLLQSYVRKTK